MLDRFVAISIFILLCFIASFSYAADLSIALIDDMVFNKEYETDSDVTKNIIDEKNELCTKLSLDLTDFANVYGLLGAVTEAKFKLDWSDGTYNKVETDSGFLWGAGLGIVFSVEEMFFIGSDTHFLTWEADVDSVSEGGSRASDISGDSTYHEAQTSIYIGKSFDTIVEGTEISFIPYIGGLYHYSEYDLDVNYDVGGTPYNITMQDFQNDEKLGIVVGIDIEFSDFFILTIEGRSLSEEALTVGTSLKF